ncbi:hypothetical protein ACHAWO_000282 [Cyclotella atomus]|uniref:ParB/Sulfiredoxin domain-containing protein n=1 Tax=Cyclotella atomus TaxID=382360 RepID=A0ABD3P3T1_9STRA
MAGKLTPILSPPLLSFRPSSSTTMMLSPPAAARAARLSNRRASPSLILFERRLSSQQRRKNTDTNVGEPWWSLPSLHKRVATMLATSLPDSYRSDLHQSLSASLNEDDGHKSHSVNEAIVSAQAREASSKHKISGASIQTNQLQLEWLEKQKTLEEEIEQRALEKAKERIQLELIAMQEQMKRQEDEQRRKLEVEMQRKVAFERWQSTVEEEKQRQQKDRGHHRQLEEVSDSASVDDVSVDDSKHDETHPILGQKLADLSYKRIHLMSAATLASLPVYEKQRAYRHDRATLMAKDKKKTLWMGIPGVISLAEDKSGKLSILDGQHRVGMIALLAEEQRKLRETAGQHETKENEINELALLDLQKVLVEVFPQRARDDSVLVNDNDLDDKAVIFTEINKAEPIKLLDLPGVATKQTRNIIDHAASHFHDSFPAMFSASQKCRAPHLNLDNLREALFASDIIKREKIGGGGELVKLMLKKNLELRVKYVDNNGVGEEDGEDGKQIYKSKVSDTALNKAKKHDFYLGLESIWLYK